MLRSGPAATRFTRTPSGQLCRGDIAQAVDRTANFPAGSCSFGDFVPYTRR